MYSGVSGMKAHQVRMDVIGNNISNVNTYGFKGSRATFRDVYYQSMRGAAEGTSNKGGLNPTQIGYGAQIGSVDKLMTQSTMSTTGNPLDVGIAGEGFLQVQDADGNIFYTKAGMLDIDPAGNLTDVNGNFVLGVSGKSLGKAPGSSKIAFQIPSVPPKKPSAMKPINDVQYTVGFSKENSDGNVSVNFTSKELGIGKPVEVDMSSSSNISVVLNSSHTFADMAELNAAINAAIKDANGGKEHPGGTLTISSNAEKPFAGLTGKQIVDNSFDVVRGKVPVPHIPTKAGGTDFFDDLFSFDTVSDGFTGKGEPITYKVIEHSGQDYLDSLQNVGAKRLYDFEVNVGGTVYSLKDVTSEQLKNPNKITLKNGSGNSDTLTLNTPSLSDINGKLAATASTDFVPAQPGPPIIPAVPATIATFPAAGWATPAGVVATASEPSKNLGLEAEVFRLLEGTKGGPQTVNDLSGIKIGADGIITAVHPVHGPIEVGRIDLATFANQAGLEQSGNTYFAASANSGSPVLKAPGSAGTGALAQSALEMSNVDLSQEFSDMITTQRGFQANSRLITVSDTMLEELINLKR